MKQLTNQRVHRIGRASMPAACLIPLLVAAFLLSAGCADRASTRPGAPPAGGPVETRYGTLTLPTYPWGPDDINPCFQWTERRNVYPYPMQDHLGRKKEDRTYRALELENEYLKVVVVPELGGHVHSVLDKTTGKQMFYENKVVKPGLIGLRGAWISGGIEFNTGPQSHTVTAVSPVRFRFVDYDDGSRAIAVGNVDRVMRTQWVAVVRLHPGRSFLHERIRIYNPQPTLATYYFWNCAAVPNTDGMRFMIPMTLGQDHAGTSFFEWPVDKGKDLSWSGIYRSPTSIFAFDCDQDFSGSYDYDEDRGVVAVADHRKLPGKKAWTWGRGEEGARAMATITDDGSWYNEIQTGPLNTQADDGLLYPHQTVEWEEWWYPVHGVHGYDFANRDIAVSVAAEVMDAAAVVRVIGTATWEDVVCEASNAEGKRLQPEVLTGEAKGAPRKQRLAPDAPALFTFLGTEVLKLPYHIRLIARSPRLGTDPNVLADFTYPLPLPKRAPPDLAARTNPGESAHDLWRLGVAEKQNGRGKSARDRFMKALEKDPRFAPALEMAGELELEWGLLEDARKHLERALEINPDLGWSRCWLAETFMRLGDDARAVDEAGKATRYPETASFAFALAGKGLLRRGEFEGAISPLQEAIARDPGNLTAGNMLYMALFESGMGLMPKREETLNLLRLCIDVGTKDPCDPVFYGYPQSVSGLTSPDTRMDVASFFAGLKLKRQAGLILDLQPPIPSADLPVGLPWAVPEADAHLKGSGPGPMPLYFLAVSEHEAGHSARVPDLLARAAACSPDCVFPNRWEEEVVLREAAGLAPRDWKIQHYLGNYYMAHYRNEEAVACWKRALDLGSDYSVTHRNLGIVAWKIDNDAKAATAHYERAIARNPKDLILYRDLGQILLKEGDTMGARDVLLKTVDLPESRIDVIEPLARALHQLGQDAEAAALIASRTFHAWENQHALHEVYAAVHLALGRKAFDAGNPAAALKEFEAALAYPDNLGAGRPENAEEAEMYYGVGMAKEALGDAAGARAAFGRAAGGADRGSAQNREAAAKAGAKLAP